MDTLMDKLAQKLNAQEMIRANGEAEAEQMQYLKAQVNEYQGCLDRLAQVCNELGSLETRLADLSLPGNGASEEAVTEIKNQIETLAQSTDSQLKELSNSTNDKLNELTSSTNDRLREFSNSTNDKLNELSSNTNDRLAELSNSTNDQFRNFSESTSKQLQDMQGELLEKVGSEENLHKEGVRIYKNIQASMINELEPIEDTVKTVKKEIINSLKGIKVLAVVAVILSALTLAIQIIKLLGLI